MRIVKGSLLTVLYLLLSLPIIQQAIHLWPEGKLNGAVSNAPDTTFSIDGWLQGRYQEEKEKYLNDNMGLRPYLVRVNNEIDYRLFTKVHEHDVVVGKEHCLYEKGYIDAYWGLDYPGIDKIREQAIKLKRIQDTLEHLGKELIMIHAPSKAWFYPEYFPDNMKCAQGAHTMYKDYIRLEDSLGIHMIDFNAWFLKMKDTSKNLLMSKQGIHWTMYGGMLAGDSMIRYIQRLTKIKQPDMVFDKLTYSDSHATDADIAQGLNLLFPITKETYTYADVHYTSGPGIKKLNAIYIGDSFVWTLLYDYIPHNFNKDWDYWYYFGDVWYRRDGKEGSTGISEYDWKAALSRTDIVVMLFTDVNLVNLGCGFVDRAYDYYYPKEKKG